LVTPITATQRPVKVNGGEVKVPVGTIKGRDRSPAEMRKGRDGLEMKNEGTRPRRGDNTKAVFGGRKVKTFL